MAGFIIAGVESTIAPIGSSRNLAMTAVASATVRFISGASCATSPGDVPSAISVPSGNAVNRLRVSGSAGAAAIHNGVLCRPRTQPDVRVESATGL